MTPSLNQGRFLQQCIDTITAQNWSNIEHFIIDGGSTDETLDILERNKDRLTGYISEPDEGAADAINKGLARCTGDIIAWLNADDFYLPGAFERAAEAWRINPDASFWFGNGLRVDEAGTIKARFNPNPIIFDLRVLTEGLDYILQPATFINAKALKEVGPLDMSLRWSFDWDLWLRLCKVAQPTTIQADLAASREWGSTLTAGGGFRRAEELRALAERYSGRSLTVGAALYQVDTFLNAVRADADAWAPDTEARIIKLWAKLRDAMKAQLPVDDSGMPIDPTLLSAERPAPVDPSVATKPNLQHSTLSKFRRWTARMT